MKTFKEYLSEKVVKSVVVGYLDHQLHDHGYGYQVRIYDKNTKQLKHSDMTKNSLEKGLASLEDNVSYSEKQLKVKREPE